ncbi:MAG: GNAT family protein [bacterium]|nr:GNAT family protein [bacterium]
MTNKIKHELDFSFLNMHALVIFEKMLMPVFKPFPIIKTERLVLRRINENDKNDIFNHRSNVEVLKYLDRAPMKVCEDAIHHIRQLDNQIENNESLIWGIALKGEQRLIGTIAFHRLDKPNYRADLGYMLMPSFWKLGLMSEVLKEVIEYGFEVMKLHTIEAQINPFNMASEKILNKFSFVKEAHFKQNYLFNGTFVDSVVYSLINPKHTNIQSTSTDF